MKRSFSAYGAFLLFCAVSALAWFGVFAPLWEWRNQTIADASLAQQNVARLTATRLRLEQEEVAFRDGTNDDLFWTAEQLGEAYAKVQANISDAARLSGISLRATTPLPSRASGDLDNVIVRIEFEAELGQMTSFLRQIEYNSPAMPIQRATLRRVLRPNVTSPLPILFAQIDISAPALIEDDT